MKNTIKLRFFALEKGVRQKEEVKGELYYVAKFLDDESNKMVSILLDDVKLADEVAKCEKYKEYLCDIKLERNRYGQYEMHLLSVA